MRFVWGLLLLVAFLALAPQVRAVENPQSGAIGVEGAIPAKPPTRGATIATPTNGQTFTSTPTTVNGLCPDDLFVKVFSNNVFVGAVMCKSGSYSLQVDLFGGRNDLVARVYDALDQPGPDSNIMTVTLNDSQFNPQTGQLLSLTSNFGRRGANPGEVLTWPIILSGGNGPYAISVDWGDSKSSDLMSLEFAGAFDISHVYDNAGVYRVIVKATDKNGLVAFLQLVGAGTGSISQASTVGNSQEETAPLTRILWAPAAVTLVLLPVAFWLGQRYELAALRKRLER